VVDTVELEAGSGPVTEVDPSVLYRRGSPPPDEDSRQPEFFRDLNLDQVLAALVDDRETYALEQFFHEPLHDEADVRYRQEVMRELEREDLRSSVLQFAAGMREMRDRLDLSSRLRNHHQSRRWFVAAIESYCRAVALLSDSMGELEVSSEGLAALRGHVNAYARSEEYAALCDETAAVLDELSAITYSIRIRGLKVTVDGYRGEPDLSTQVEETFAKFRQGDVRDHTTSFHERPEVNPVEDRILELVAKQHHAEFEHLRDYCVRRQHAVDRTLLRFDREVQFYLAYLEYIAPLRAAGLQFSYPSVSATEKRVLAREAFDIALARKRIRDGLPLVRNDVELRERERMLVITGPNQGGKTTYARAFGQIHHLAALGLPVPGSEAQVFLPDRLFTHFERREDVATLRSKFEDELQRMHEILGQATGSSVLILNESFTSTALSDAEQVGTLVLREVLERGMLCVCVTFVDELSTLSEEVVSMMSTVAEDDPTRRPYRVIRKPADGLAHAIALADRHGLSYETLKRRIEG